MTQGGIYTGPVRDLDGKNGLFAVLPTVADPSSPSPMPYSPHSAQRPTVLPPFPIPSARTLSFRTVSKGPYSPLRYLPLSSLSFLRVEFDAKVHLQRAVVFRSKSKVPQPMNDNYRRKYCKCVTNHRRSTFSGLRSDR